MRLLIKVLVILIVAISIFSVSGCSKAYLTNTEKSKTIDIIVKMKEAEFFKTVKAGAEAAGKEFDIKINFNAPEDERDINGQIAMVNEAIERKTSAIVLAASDFKKLVNVVEKAHKAKIPVIIIDSALDSDSITSFIATDNRAAGRMAAKKFVEICGEDCKIAIMNFVKGSASADEREEGFMEIINKYSGIKVVAKEYCYSDSKLSSELTGKMLREHPEVNIMIGFNAQATEGIARAIKNRGLQSKIKIMGFDSTPEEIEFIEDDVIQATVVQRPFNMGYLGVKYAALAADGKNVPKVVDTGSKVIDKSNLYTPENQKLLFPFVK